MRNELRAFPVGVAEQLDSYVYLYQDPNTEEVFYIGKGQGNRVFNHLDEADDIRRKSAKVERIRKIWHDELDVIVQIHRHSMTPEEALHVEASLIEIFPDATNEVEGHHSSNIGARLVSDLISEKQREQVAFDFPIVLINIRKAWLKIRPKATRTVDPGLLYNHTRTAWAIQPSRHKKVKHAAAVAFGIIREVFEIDRWTPADVNADLTSRDSEDGRWMFDGRVATDKLHLVGKAIDHLQKPGAQNPIKWLDNGTPLNLSEKNNAPNQ